MFESVGFFAADCRIVCPAGKRFRLVDRCTAYAPYMVGFRQHVTAHEIDEKSFRLLYALIGVMTLAQADRYPVMADNSRVFHCELVRFSFDLRPGNRRRFGIERQRIPEIFLVRFHYIGLNGVFLDSRACSDISMAWGRQVLHGTGHDLPVYDREVIRRCRRSHDDRPITFGYGV